MKKSIILLLLVAITSPIFSQSGSLGVLLGATYYNGDYNKFMPFNPPNVAGGIIFARDLDKYKTIRMQADFGILNGPASHTFNTNYFKGGLMFEQNLLPFSARSIKNTFILVPYVEVGAFFLYVPNTRSTINMSIPVGAGVKYALSEMATLSFEWNYNFTNTDILDETGYDVNNRIKRLNLHNDYFSFVGFVLRYNIFYRDKLCPAYY
jgi:hypothetical protein